MAMATSPPAVSLVRNVNFIFISIVPFPLSIGCREGW
jgi:hypothetical protein